MNIEKISKLLEKEPTEIKSDSIFSPGDILLYLGTADPTQNFMPDLCEGMRGKYEIGVLQRLLKSMGFYTGDIDDSFGNLTRTAVIKFQTKNNISVKEPGTVGNKTWLKILKGV